MLAQLLASYAGCLLAVGTLIVYDLVVSRINERMKKNATKHHHK